MRKLILTTAAALMLGAAPAAILAAPGAVVQVQANPRGPGPATATPPDPVSASEPVAPAMPADPGYRAGPYKGALTPPPAEAFNKVYPVCSRTLRDSCINPDAVRSTMRAAANRRVRHVAKGG